MPLSMQQHAAPHLADLARPCSPKASSRKGGNSLILILSEPPLAVVIFICDDLNQLQA